MIKIHMFYMAKDEWQELGNFWVPAVPRRGDRVCYTGMVFTVKDVSWETETDADTLDKIVVELKPR